ncbi:molybdenum cofactor sulfurase isoform X1 [Ziziphus jujuba]|uniref:Molybdenum cofactor sulfurase n=1 Tax=Ziziphus jujuba TaxID=326968 RepID=A0A6P3ZRU4_ZIZJJ|nr:molybdenum cofactor sulfurase isoform X1 [Ziziphus jujuba]
MDVEKEVFLQEFGESYGYPNGPKTIDEIRATEFKRLDGKVYLDHAGATLYSESQMEAIFKNLTANVYGNPHSQSDTSSATGDLVREARQQVLDYFKASPKEYSCIFTSGATAALKLVGESFPWSRNSCFMYTMENHNSVLGIREYALDQGASAFAIDIEEETVHHKLSNGSAASMGALQHQVQRRNEARFPENEPTGNVYNLFAFPSECNFSGLKFSLDLVKTIKKDSKRILGGSPFCNGHWMVFIDAAKGCATEPPDLSQYPADFVCVSFYKIFGYPTGLGALLARNDAAKLLKKTYFSGGTVAASIADVDFVQRRKAVEELFEDGTISFLSIASILHGFRILNSLTVAAISQHTKSLAIYVRKMLLSLGHENGASVCIIYGCQDSKVLYRDFGPVISFNLKRPDGSWYGYREVEKLASLSGIQLRTGCFCNPGACAKYLGLSHLDLLSNIEAGHVCWDDHDILNGKPTGAVRVSFGYMSTYEDAKSFIDFVRRSFVELPNCTANGFQLKQGREIRPAASFYLKNMIIYPIKSCGGFSVESWPLSSTGLRHDREWVLTGLSGEILTQKKVPDMCSISTFIDINQGILFVESPRCKDRLHINLMLDSCNSEKEEIHNHGHRYEVLGYNNEVNTWFSNAIGRPCILARSFSSSYNGCLNKGKKTGICRDVQGILNFVNEAQLLLISEESVADLNNRLSKNAKEGAQGAPVQVNPMRFRPNIVISGGEPYAEDGWRNIKMGNKCFTSVGGCNRCQMINIVQDAGQTQKSNEPLATLASYRRVKGKILFGILLKYERCEEEEGKEVVDGDNDLWLQVGQEVYPDSFQHQGNSMEQRFCNLKMK